MKKIYIIISCLLLGFVCFLIYYFLPKSYEVSYKIDVYDILEKYNKNTGVFKIFITKENEVYPFTFIKDIDSGRYIVKKVNFIKENDYRCVIIDTEVRNYLTCYQDNKLIEHNLLDGDLINLYKNKNLNYSNKYKSINVYDISRNYMVWNYKGFISINDNNEYKLFNKEKYNNIETYQDDRYLFIPDYDSNYYFKKMYIYDSSESGIVNVSFDYEISYDILYLGVIDDSLYFIDKKNSEEYKLDIEQKTMSRIEDSKYYENGKWINKEIKEIKESFKIEKSYVYELLDDCLYLVIDEYKIKVSDKKVKEIVYESKNSIYYLSGNILYGYNVKNGEVKLLEYSEWNFNYKNQIFIFD